MAATIFAALLTLPNYLTAFLILAVGASVFLLLRLTLPLSVMKRPFTVGARKGSEAKANE